MLRLLTGSTPREAEAKPTDTVGSAPSGDISSDQDVWDVVYSLMAVDTACYLLYIQEVGSFDSHRALPRCTAVAVKWVLDFSVYLVEGGSYVLAVVCEVRTRKSADACSTCTLFYSLA